MPVVPRRLALVTLSTLALGALVGAGAGVGSTSGTAGAAPALAPASSAGAARNVILLVGDGMSDSEITLARNYLVGAGGRLALDGLPHTGSMTTYSVQENAPSKPDYTAESAGTASAWSTGRKTSDRRISTLPGSDRDAPTMLELARRAGYKTGNVTTADLTDATPAAAMAHVRSRSCQGPANLKECPQDRKAAGGPGSIAEQSVDQGVDVLLGGGRSRYEQVIREGRYAGHTVLQSAVSEGYRVVGDRTELASARSGEKLLGLFAPGHLGTEFRGRAASRPASGPQRCQEGKRPSAQPSLAEMTGAALRLLDDPATRGFWLQVESASIDKSAHAARPCEQIGETKNLDEAVAAALEFARTHQDTLVIVLGDHAQAGQIVEADAVVPGLASKLVTREGSSLQVSYATSTSAKQGHTGTQVRIAAYGPEGHRVEGLIDQTEVFDIVTRALGLA